MRSFNPTCRSDRRSRPLLLEPLEERLPPGDLLLLGFSALALSWRAFDSFDPGSRADAAAVRDLCPAPAPSSEGEEMGARLFSLRGEECSPLPSVLGAAAQGERASQATIRATTAPRGDWSTPFLAADDPFAVRRGSFPAAP